MNKISIIIPCYQHASTIRATLEAIFAQTKPADEIILVNDGSTDGLHAELAPYQDRIQLIDQENQGGNHARNRGYTASTGDYILFCDADVIMAPDMLEKMARELDDHPEASYVYSGFRFGWKSFHGFPFDEERLRQMNFVHTTSLIRRDHFPGFDTSIKRLQDWDVWLTMLENGHLGFFLDEELFYVQDARDRRGISQWRPSIMYKIPWKLLGWKPESIRKYDEAKEVLVRKHQL